MADEATIEVRHRSLRGVPRLVEVALLSTLTVAGALWALDVLSYLRVSVFQEQYLGLVWSLVLASVFVTIPGSRRAAADRVPWYDWCAALASAVVGGYVTLFYPRLLFTSALATPDKYLLGALSLLLLIEATRRLVGGTLLVILLGFLAYAATAGHWPGVLQGNQATPQRLLIYLYLDTNSLLGIPLAVAATIVLAYVLLGQMLYVSGGGTFFTDLASAAMGRFRGGPAKIAVVGSSLFGMISGSAVSNVMTVGIITIPLMKKNGYPKEIAGAIEAVGSTGGQLMPPVMGASAFVMAELLEISYGRVALAAAIPAVLYYLLLFVQVDLEAAKRGIAGLPRQELPRVGAVLRRGWPFVLPIAVLIVALFWLNFSAGKAGMAGVGTVALIMLLRPASRPDRRALLNILVGAGRGMLDVTLLCGLAGVIIGVLNITGLGFGISLLLVKVGGSSLFALLLMTAGVSIILGMGMPTVSVYLLLAVLIGPALIKLGLDPISAHLFLQYYGMMSMITPPVALAAYAAASLAGSDAFRTGWTAVRLGAMAFVAPFIFIYAPELLLEGRWFNILMVVTSTALGAFMMGVGMVGYYRRPVPLLRRGLLLLAALGLFFDHRFHGGLGYTFNAAGGLLGIALLLLERAAARREGAAQPVAEAPARSPTAE
jgi:TRAP transporter 4TM/12TM fusion protein